MPIVGPVAKSPPPKLRSEVTAYFNEGGVTTAVATSSNPSPLRSPRAAAKTGNVEGVVEGGASVPLPTPARKTSVEPAAPIDNGTITSGKPSPVTSPTEAALGFVPPTGNENGPTKPPIAEINTEICVELVSVDTRSRWPSRLRSAAAM